MAVKRTEALKRHDVIYGVEPIGEVRRYVPHICVGLLDDGKPMMSECPPQDTVEDAQRFIVEYDQIGGWESQLRHG